MVTRRFALILLAGVPLPALLPAPWIGLLIVLGFAVCVAGLDIAVAGPLTAVRLSRSGDRTVWLGGTATVSLTVVNAGRRPLRLHLRDSWVPSAGAWPSRHDVFLPRGTHQDLVTKLNPVRHGDRPAVRVTVRSMGPFGVAYRQKSRKWNAAISPAWVLRVLPHFPSRRILPEKLARMRVVEGSSVTRGRGHGTEFDALREYVIGDDVRSIDWRASARHNDVMVRTWRPERDRRVVCVIDTGRTSAARVGDAPRLDASIDAALLLSVLGVRAGDRVSLFALDAVVRSSLSSSSSQASLGRLIDAMASLEPAAVETDWSALATSLLRRDQKRSLVVIFTALEPAPIVEGLLPLLPRLTARHQVVVAGVRDPSVSRLVSLPASPGAFDVHAAAAAQRVLSERDRVREVLSRFGAIVVDADAGDFAGKVADVYLLLKATGRL
ncbi:uncharacterized protein (DUF58 family) [Actinoplanes lutulentus]|uniref:Uncharacterized protein (DUF58 family) n=1 Tax=Actinoplanes lutulentus TaxID=1287878 RepID=A0A327ZAS0_9ACTN|nr:DUF58 domain-containing protein [Actinoplanes lutulentus]MBB2947429.1 uncharacterized protein (DUF58 family) [Actinoplanes lutulentus]RAK36702.1 uncharacterized protein (DUF58 family) [Actinoplanes lutulentus]